MSLLYLSAAEVAAAGVSPGVAREAVVSAFRAHGAGRTVTRPKLTLGLGPGRAFQSMCAAWADAGLAGTKWLGTAPAPAGSGLPTVESVILLNDQASGRLLAVMDGNGVTALRTAAMSAAAAQFLARADSRTIGFVGCGLQARAHLAAFRALLPGLVEVHAVSRTRRSAEALAAEAAGHGMAVHVHDGGAAGAEAVVRASDVLVTSVPMEEGFVPFLDPAWIRPGAFVSSVDIGRPWLPGLRALDVLATDDHGQQAENPPVAPGLGPPGSYDAELAELACGTHAGRRGEAERAMFIFRGFALADLAVAAEVLKAARAAGAGLVLPR